MDPARFGEITVHDLADGGRFGTVPLPGPGTVGALSERPEGGDEGWFAYTDNTTPVDGSALRRGYRRDAGLGPASRRGGRSRGDRPADPVPL